MVKSYGVVVGRGGPCDSGAPSPLALTLDFGLGLDNTM